MFPLHERSCLTITFCGMFLLLNQWQLFSQEVLFSCPQEIVGKIEYNATYPNIPRYNKELVYDFNYSKSKDLLSSHISMMASEKESVVHSLFRQGELVTQYLTRKNGSISSDATSFHSNAANAEIPQSLPSQVFLGIGHCPIVGCIAGFYLEDYFPVTKTVRVAEDDGVIQFQATTKYGEAQIWTDTKRGNLPIRFSVTKEANNHLPKERKLGDVIYFKKSPESRLTSATFELEVTDVGRTDSKDYFIKNCRLQSREFSNRGLEGEISIRWSIDRASFQTPSTKQAVSLFEVKDGQKIQVKGAPQLPYSWSDEEQWVLADVRSIKPDEKRTKSSRFISITIVFILFSAVASLLIYFKNK